jgi:4-carboxymuconolactone decarboxylase
LEGITVSRITPLTRDEVPAALHEAYDTVIAANGGKYPIGPGIITLHSPEMASRRSPLSAYMRYQIDLPDRIVELAILTAARCHDCPYVWSAHAGPARKAGVSDALLTALREDRPLPDAPEDELAVIRYGLEVMRKHAASDEIFQAALAHFGTQKLVELTSLMGHYAQNAYLVNAFALEVPADEQEPSLPVSPR